MVYAYLVTTCGACQVSSDADVATRGDSAGVTVVLNGGNDQAIRADFVKDFEIGGEADGPASFYALEAPQIAVGTDGEIAVLDRRAARVTVFDPDGPSRLTFGREGDGPGEFRYPVSIAGLPDGRFVVYDYQKRALQYFASDGTFVDQRLVTFPFNGYGMVSSPTGLLVFSQSSPRRGGELQRRNLHVTANDTVQLGPASSSQTSAVSYESCGVRLTQPPLFASQLVWSSNGRRTVVVSGPEYSVHVFDGVTPTAVVRRDLAPEPVTPDVLRRTLGDGEEWDIGGRPCTVPPGELIEQRGHAEYIPIVESLAVAPSGDLWVKRRLVGSEERRIDLLAADGQYRGSIAGDSPFPTAFMPDGRLLTIESDSFEVERIVAYRVSLRIPR